MLAGHDGCDQLMGLEYLVERGTLGSAKGAAAAPFAAVAALFLAVDPRSGLRACSGP
jgi:hypothetical protein